MVHAKNDIRVAGEELSHVPPPLSRFPLYTLPDLRNKQDEIVKSIASIPLFAKTVKKFSSFKTKCSASVYQTLLPCVCPPLIIILILRIPIPFYYHQMLVNYYFILFN